MGSLLLPALGQPEPAASPALLHSTMLREGKGSSAFSLSSALLSSFSSQASVWAWGRTASTLTVQRQATFATQTSYQCPLV